MIKDTFILSKNSWHLRLMNYIWDLNHNDFSHICPYFWLSIFNVLIIIPYFIIVQFKYLRLVFIPFNYVLDKLEERDQRLYLEQYNLIKDNPEELQKFIYRNLYCRQNKFFDFIGCLDYKLYDKLKTEKSRLRYKIEDEKRRIIQNKKQINLNLKWIKPLAKGVLALLGISTILGIVYLGYKLVLLSLKYRIDWERVLLILYASGAIVIIAIVVYSLIFGIGKIFKSLDIGCRIKRVNWSFLGILFISIGKFFIILFTILKSNCPSISWKNE